MTRVTTFASSALALTLTLACATGCDKAADDQNKANAAQAEADKKIATAEGDFGKRREDYRHKVQTDLIDLDKKIDILEAKSKTATGKAKVDLDANLAAIRTRRTAFAQDMKGVDTATALTWDDMKTRVDKSWTDLKALVDKAS